MPELDDKKQGNSTQIDKGVYASKVTVVRIEDKSVHPRWKDNRDTTFKSGKPIELYLHVTYDTGEWQKKLVLMGNYKVDKVTGQIKGWQAKRNNVQDFLITLLGKNIVQQYLNEDYSIKPEMLNMLVGREFYRVSFVSGTYNEKPSYQDWRQVFKPEVSIEDIKKEWLSAVPFIKQYTPDVVEMGDDTKFNYGANTDTAAEEDVI